MTRGRRSLSILVMWLLSLVGANDNDQSRILRMREFYSLPANVAHRAHSPSPDPGGSSDDEDESYDCGASESKKQKKPKSKSNPKKSKLVKDEDSATIQAKTTYKRANKTKENNSGPSNASIDLEMDDHSEPQSSGISDDKGNKGEKGAEKNNHARKLKGKNECGVNDKKAGKTGGMTGVKGPKQGGPDQTNGSGSENGNGSNNGGGTSNGGGNGGGGDPKGGGLGSDGGGDAKDGGMGSDGGGDANDGGMGSDGGGDAKDDGMGSIGGMIDSGGSKDGGIGSGGGMIDGGDAKDGDMGSGGGVLDGGDTKDGFVGAGDVEGAKKGTRKRKLRRYGVRGQA
jgi:hypothetical protein